MQEVADALAAPGRPEAAAAIWRWRETARTETASDRGTRVRGALQGAAGAVVGGIAWAVEWHGLATAALAIGAIVLLAALVSPRGLYAAIHRLFEATGRWVGTGLTWILLVPVFYLFFLPFGVLFRRGRRDRMRRFYDASATTYWEPHEGLLAASGRADRQY